MTRPRRELVCVAHTPYYHIISRCVRRAFLCGVDQHTNTSYEHRRQWVVDRIHLLSSLFAVDICAYAVMSNHYHIVLKLDPIQVESWSDDDVLLRWTSLCKGSFLVQRYMTNEGLTAVELNTLDATISVLRQRLSSLSWFMKFLNEHVARAANTEDNCTGHFWEARYKSQALNSEEALIQCMAYVDLNPVRAGIATTPEGSDYTSIKERIEPSFDPAQAIRQQIEQNQLYHMGAPIKPLMHFDGGIRSGSQTGIPASFEGYLQFLDWVGRAVRGDKRGAIDNSTPNILTRLSASNPSWLEQTTQFERHHRKRVHS